MASNSRHAGNTGNELHLLLIISISLAYIVYVVHDLLPASHATIPTQHVLPSDNTTLAVHFVKIYSILPPTPHKQLCFLECLSLLSVVKHLKPDMIYLHTNAPDFWPFPSSCQPLFTVFPTITMLHLEPTVTINGQRVAHVQHQADIAKMQVVKKYGGIAMDFDIFIIRGQQIRDILRSHDCLLIHEGPKMFNAGFTACRKGARWPAIVLDLYRKDYQAGWFYNSAKLPFRVLKKYNKKFRSRIYMDRTISDNPSGKFIHKILHFRGMVKWRDKLAFHSYYHRCDIDVSYINASQSSFGEILRFVLYDTNSTADAVVA